MSLNSSARHAQLAGGSWTGFLAALGRPSTPQKNSEISQEPTSFRQGLFSTPASASLASWPPHGTRTSAAAALWQNLQKDLCIPTRRGAELVTGGVGLVHLSGKRWDLSLGSVGSPAWGEVYRPVVANPYGEMEPMLSKWFLFKFALLKSQHWKWATQFYSPWLPCPVKGSKSAPANTRSQTKDMGAGAHQPNLGSSAVWHGRRRAALSHLILYLPPRASQVLHPKFVGASAGQITNDFGVSHASKDPVTTVFVTPFTF